MAPADGLVAGVRDEQIAGRHDRVRLLPVGRQHVIDARDPHQRLLREVLDQVVVAGARGKHVPHHLGEISQGVGRRPHRPWRTGMTAGR